MSLSGRCGWGGGSCSPSAPRVGTSTDGKQRRDAFSCVAHDTRSGWGLGANAARGSVEEAHLAWSRTAGKETDPALHNRPWSTQCPHLPQTLAEFPVPAALQGLLLSPAVSSKPSGENQQMPG